MVVGVNATVCAGSLGPDLDGCGGGSSTLWMLGRVMNSPIDGVERPVANGLVVIQKERPSVERVR